MPGAVLTVYYEDAGKDDVAEVGTYADQGRVRPGHPACLGCNLVQVTSPDPSLTPTGMQVYSRTSKKYFMMPP